jgi:hypothetical protein
MIRVVVVAMIAACGPPPVRHVPPGGDDPAMLPPLLPPAPINTPQFASVVVCDRCHTAGAKAMRNAAGVDISPVTEIQAGMMSLSARDPYFLAALRREIAANPGAKTAIESICLRCHAPVGFAERPQLSLDELITSTSPAAALGREGVGCAGCHALEPEKLGDERSFTGGVALRRDRVSFGLLPEPLAEAMVQMSKTKPVPSQHIGESRLCASCHTVLVRRLDTKGAPIGDEIPEQTTFLEWRASAYVDGGERAKTCQGCHMPRSEDELGKGPDIQTPFATRPVDAPTRQGYRRHALRGGNSYLLRRLADHFEWLNAATKPELLRAAADATDTFLTSSAQLLVESATAKSIKLTVSNRTGHKLPTGYPTRRMWLHVTITDATGKTLFESGKHHQGALTNSGRRLDGPGVIEPHRSKLDGPDQTIIWESVPVDDKGKRTHLLLGTAAIVKDNRILPMGWKRDHPDAARTKPVGVDGDPDFVAGQDSIEIAVPAGAARAHFELLYQPIPPETIESYQRADSREAARFLDIVAKPPEPVVLAAKQIALE